MSTDHSERTVRPSLLDRLIDDVNQHEPRTWEESVAAFKASVMRDLRAQYGLAILWITHDLDVVAELADDVAVMYAGRIVERAMVQP